MAAKHLLAQHGHLKPLVGQKGLEDGGEQGDLRGMGLAQGFIGVVQLFVDQRRGGDHHCPAAFAVGLGGQQHAAHIRVHDDGVGRQVLGLGAREAAHLQPVLGIGQCILVGYGHQAQRLVGNAQARGIHHHKHRLQALVGLAHQGAHGAVDGDLCGGIAMDAHLVLQARAADRVARPQRAIGVDEELGYQEQADALAAFGRIGQAGQHQVHDVVGHVVLTGADEDLIAGDLVAAIGLGLGLGAQQTQVGAAMGLGQAHGASPLAAGELGQVELFLLVRAIHMERLIGAVRQAGVHGPGLVGAVEHFIQALVQHKGQALAAIGAVAGQGRPAAFHILGIGLFETLGRRHTRIGRVARAAFSVARQVERLHHFDRELAGLFQDRIHGAAVDVGIGGQLRKTGGQAQHFLHEELHVAQRRGVLRHGKSFGKMTRSNRNGSGRSRIGLRRQAGGERGIDQGSLALGMDCIAQQYATQRGGGML